MYNMASFDEKTDIITEWMRESSAYALDGYVLADAKLWPSHVIPQPPVPYILPLNRRNPDDFVVWAPYIHGKSPPWGGNGLFSANFNAMVHHGSFKRK
jgi:hypothetical protein